MRTLPQEYYRMLWELQSVDFLLLELALYLDTHPGDSEAIAQFNEYAAARAELREAFEAQFGPLLQYGNSLSGDPWSWAETPWPWQV
jgi:spore coat protein JB